MDNQKRKSEKIYSAFGTQVADLVKNIVDYTFESIPRLIRVNAAIPKKENVASENGKYKNSAAALLPGILCAGGLVVNAPAVLTGALVLAGGIGSAYLLSGNTKGTCEEKVEKAADPIVTMEIDQEAYDQIKKETDEKIDRLMDYIKWYEAEQAEGYDITMDRKFGEWVQKFLMYTAAAEDRKLERMADELITRLGSMKILVYDEVLLDETGKPDILQQDYLQDHRLGDAYTKVVKPAIYTKRGLLARGEIQ